MPEEHQVARALQWREAREQAPLRLLVEVDDHVAAEDDVKGAPHGQRVHQVQLAERHQRGEFGLHAVASCGTAAAGIEEAHQPRLRQVAQAIRAVFRRHAGLQHLGIQIRSQDAYVPALPLRHRLDHAHGDRPGLLARRASRAPDPDAVRAICLARARRQELLAQVFKVMRLAEEGREVGGNGIGEVDDLGFAIRAGQQLAVVREAGQPVVPKPARQPPVNQLALGVGQVDATEPAHQHAQRLEIRLREFEFPLAWTRIGRHAQLRTLSTVASSRSGSKGLTIQPVAPAARPSCFLSALDSVVSTSSGTPRYWGRRRSSRTSESPSMFGMFTSVITRSTGLPAQALFSPSTPSTALTTSCPADCRVRWTICRIEGESSTASIRAMCCPQNSFQTGSPSVAATAAAPALLSAGAGAAAVHGRPFLRRSPPPPPGGGASMLATSEAAAAAVPLTR